MRIKTLLLLAIVSLSIGATKPENLPVVLWHGMGASVNVGGTSELKKLIEEKLGVYVLSISTGGSDAEQVYSGFFGSITAQVQSACALIREKRELKGGYNAVGLSQGGLFLRAVVEQCQHLGPPVRTLVTLGSPHQGVINIPLCTDTSGKDSSWLDPLQWPCKAMQKVLGWGVYLPWVRDHVIQAQYFRDPFDLEGYLANNPFLPALNNERAVKDAQLRENLESLEKFALFRFDGDFTVVPRDSAWFGAVDEDGFHAMNATKLYTEDFIGLKQLDEEKRLDFRSFPGFHMQFGFDDFEDEIIWPYLSAKDDRHADFMSA